MLKTEFIQMVQDEISVSCGLPFNVPEKEIERIIMKESEWMYREYREATQTQIYVIKNDAFCTPEFRSTRMVKMPDCVIGIEVLWEITDGQRIWGINDGDISHSTIINADLYLSPWSSDTIAYRTAQWSFWDLSKSFNLKHVQFSWNVNTKRITIKGRDLIRDCFIVSHNKIDLECLLDDPLFLKWVIGKAKLQLAKILGTFNYTLVGGATINFSMYSEEGKAEIEEVKEYIKGNNPADWFIMSN